MWIKDIEEVAFTRVLFCPKWAYAHMNIVIYLQKRTSNEKEKKKLKMLCTWIKKRRKKKLNEYKNTLKGIPFSRFYF